LGLEPIGPSSCLVSESIRDHCVIPESPGGSIFYKLQEIGIEGVDTETLEAPLGFLSVEKGHDIIRLEIRVSKHRDMEGLCGSHDRVSRDVPSVRLRLPAPFVLWIIKVSPVDRPIEPREIIWEIVSQNDTHRILGLYL
jgi:hypothetical protein